MEDREKGMELSITGLRTRATNNFRMPAGSSMKWVKYTAMRATTYSGIGSSRSFTVEHASFGGSTTSECYGVMQQNKYSSTRVRVHPLRLPKVRLAAA